MPSPSRFLPAVGGGVTGAALCVGALALGGVFDEEPTQVVTASAQAASSPAVRATPAAAGSLAALYEKTSTSVVEVRAKGGGTERSSGFPDPRDDDGIATGSGFVVDEDGTIVTNAHVVGTSKDVTVRFDEDDDPVRAQVRGTDPSTDIAVLQIDPEAAGGRLDALPLAGEGEASVGDTALAIGNPFGLERTATAGIVSATGREITAPNGFSIAGAIQTDAPINPGNSGGPLLDGQGRVIGVNSQIATGGSTEGNVGIGFAVPSSIVSRVLPDLKAGRKIARAYLGVSTAEREQGDGAVVAQLVAGGPGRDAGLRVKDVITKVGDAPVAEPEDIAAAIEDRKPGDVITVTYTRGSERRTAEVRLGTRPATVR